MLTLYFKLLWSGRLSYTLISQSWTSVNRLVLTIVRPILLTPLVLLNVLLSFFRLLYVVETLSGIPQVFLLLVLVVRSCHVSDLELVSAISTFPPC